MKNFRIKCTLRIAVIIIKYYYFYCYFRKYDVENVFFLNKYNILLNYRI